MSYVRITLNLCEDYIRLIIRLILGEYGMPKKKRKGERYIDRWLKEHPQIRLYLTKDEYEFVKKVAEAWGIPIKKLVLEGVKCMEGLFEVAEMSSKVLIEKLEEKQTIKQANE